MAADAFAVTHVATSPLIAWFVGLNTAIRRAHPRPVGMGSLLCGVVLALALAALLRADGLVAWLDANRLVDEGGVPIARFLLPFLCCTTLVLSALAGWRLLAAIAY